MFFREILDWHQYFIHKVELYCALASKKKSIPDWHLFITQMETKLTKWYAMTSHVIAYQSSELLFGTHTFNFNCFFEDFNCVFTQIRCLSRVLPLTPGWGKKLKKIMLHIKLQRKKLRTLYGSKMFDLMLTHDGLGWVKSQTLKLCK